MNAFEKALAQTLGEKNLKKIQSVKVGMAGAGGLGSNCSLFLVRSGFKRFKIVDFDVVEGSNLNRQFYFLNQLGQIKVEALRENLLRINPDLFIEVLPVKIEPDTVKGLFADCDVVVEALDLAYYKRMVVEAYLNTDKLLVAASGLAGWGRSDGITTRRLKKSFFLIGDQVSEAGPGLPAMAPGVNVAAAKQADVVLDYVLNNNHPDGGD